MRRVRERSHEISNYCNIEIVISVVGGKWKLVLLKYLLSGRRRFGELKRMFPAITQRMLSRQLRELEEDLIVKRTAYPEVPPRVEYSLTEVGRSLEPLIAELDTWGGWYRKRAQNYERVADDRSIE